MRPRWSRRIRAWRAKRIQEKKQRMAEGEGNENGPPPNQSEEPKYLEDVEEAKGSTSINANTHESDAVDLPNDEVVVPGNEEDQPMSDQSRSTVIATTGTTSKISDLASPGNFDIILKDIDMDPSVAIASSAHWAVASYDGPSDNRLCHLGLGHLGDDSQMNLNVDRNPSVAIAAWSLLVDNVDGY